MTRKSLAPATAAANGVLPRFTTLGMREASRARTSGSWASALNSASAVAASSVRCSRLSLSARRVGVSRLAMARARTSRAGGDDIARNSRRLVLSSRNAARSVTVMGQELASRWPGSPRLTIRI